MFYSKKLAKEVHIRHCFFNRLGGKSKGIYESLNCGRGSLDKRKYINKNLVIASKKICKSYKRLVLLNQIHSNKFFFIKSYKFKKKKTYRRCTNY